MAVGVPSEHRPDISSESALERVGVSDTFNAPVSGSVTVRGNGLRGNRSYAGIGVSREFARYVVVGGLSFICDTSTLFTLTQFFKVNYLISGIFGFIFGVAVNYLLCRMWVFKRRRLQSTPAEMTIFTLIGVVGLGMNELILWTFQEKLGIYYMIAKCVSGVVVLGWNFGARKLTLFR